MGAYKASDKDYELDSLGVGQAAPGASGTAKIGVGADFFEVEADGTAKFNGAGTVWDDAQVTIGMTRFAGASDPTWTAYKGGLVLAFNKAQDNIVYFTLQLSHKYKLNSNIEFHVHTAHPDGNVGDTTWHLTHSIADLNTDFPAESMVNKSIASPADADKHELHQFSTNIGSGGGLSTLILCSLQREGTDPADTYDNDVYVVAIDFHIEMDTVGSRQMAVK
jgi:hypothetical protein